MSKKYTKDEIRNLIVTWRNRMDVEYRKVPVDQIVDLGVDTLSRDIAESLGDLTEKTPNGMFQRASFIISGPYQDYGIKDEDYNEEVENLISEVYNELGLDSNATSAWMVVSLDDPNYDGFNVGVAFLPLVK